MTKPACPICADTGIAHTAPYMPGTPASHTMTACTCKAGEKLMREAQPRHPATTIGE